jgi:hypothetical protein
MVYVAFLQTLYRDFQEGPEKLWTEISRKDQKSFEQRFPGRSGKALNRDFQEGPEKLLRV